MSQAHVFLARPGAGAFEFSFKFECEFDFAGTVDLSATDYDGYGHIALLETVFAITNSYPDEMHIGDHHRGDVVEWRSRGNRSLSVGDVVLYGECFWFCTSFGWERISTASQNLRNAFLSAHRPTFKEA